MVVIKSIAKWRALRKTFSPQQTMGLVATMGALHAGHRSLLQRCRRENELSLLSIFVNPAQFDDQLDLARYPRTIEEDTAIALAEGVDFLLLPDESAMYADDYHYRVHEQPLSNILCGAHRKGHFDGVLTVVLKLLQLARPTRAYFGEKDYQQYLVVKGMTDAFFLDVDIIACPTIREPDGLALSSRNQLLTSEQRQLAANLPRLLQSEHSISEIQRQLTLLGFDVDYVTDYQGRRFVAARVGNVRLIDNVALL